MACLSLRKVAVSKTPMEEYRVNWKIVNFSQIRDSKEALESLVYRFEMGASVNRLSKWKCFLTCSSVNGRVWISPNVALDEKPDESVTDLVIAIKVKVNEVYSSVQSPTCDVLNQPFFRFIKFMPQDLGFPYYDNFVNDDGSLDLKVIVNLFDFENNPTPKLQLPLCTIQSQFEFKCREKLQFDLSKLYKNPVTLSLTLGMTKLVSSDDKEFFVNPEILTVRCPVLYSMLADETSSVLTFPDISGQHLETLLSFVHTATLPKNWKLSNETMDELVYAAQKFGLKDLVDFLEQSRRFSVRIF